MMGILKNKIDFAAIIAISGANANGDPLNGNRPRTDYDGFGEISDVCIKRKIRNRMQDMGKDIFVQTEDRTDDGCKSLSERAALILDGIADRKDAEAAACRKWLDVRAFGQVFAFKDKKGLSIGIRGPVSIHRAVSVSPVNIESRRITKSVNGEKKADGQKSSDTMGVKHFVKFGLYILKGTINARLAEKTGFTTEDAKTVKECIKTLFVNDASAARPEGSMEIVKLYWWTHNSTDGQYSSAKVHRSLSVEPLNPSEEPRSIKDYQITLERFPDLATEVIDGI